MDDVMGRLFKNVLTQVGYETAVNDEILTPEKWASMTTEDKVDFLMLVQSKHQHSLNDLLGRMFDLAKMISCLADAMPNTNKESYFQVERLKEHLVKIAASEERFVEGREKANAEADKIEAEIEKGELH